MAMNPMQRKANNYLLIGVFVTLLITGSIIAILFMQLSKINKEIKAEEAKLKSVYVASKDISSGETVDMSKLKSMKVTGEAVPSNAMKIDDIPEETGEIIAKIDLKAGTIVTTNMVNKKGEETSSDLRVQEYNMLSLPTQIESGNYIDVRLRLPNGTDYIVVSKKKVEIPTIDGVDSANTIKINVAEEEILMMSNAIVEAYWATGAKLYVTTYVEPGMQDQATATYLPSDKVVELMNTDPNILDVAKSELFARYNATAGSVRGNIVNSLNTFASEGQSNVQTGVQEEITKAKEEREEYLEALAGY